MQKSFLKKSMKFCPFTRVLTLDCLFSFLSSHILKLIQIYTFVKNNCLNGFRQFIAEDAVRSLKKGSKENYFDGLKRELGIDINLIPDFIESGPIELEDEGLWYNQAVWQVIKPINQNDTHVKVKFHKSLSPNINQRCYIKKPDGKMQPYMGDPSDRIHLITMKKLAEMMGKGWETAVQNMSSPTTPGAPAGF